MVGWKPHAAPRRIADDEDVGHAEGGSIGVEVLDGANPTRGHRATAASGRMDRVCGP
jgi:hypothetical protein